MWSVASGLPNQNDSTTRPFKRAIVHFSCFHSSGDNDLKFSIFLENLLKRSGQGGLEGTMTSNLVPFYSDSLDYMLELAVTRSTVLALFSKVLQETCDTIKPFLCGVRLHR